MSYGAALVLLFAFGYLIAELVLTRRQVHRQKDVIDTANDALKSVCLALVRVLPLASNSLRAHGDTQEADNLDKLRAEMAAKVKDL